MANKEDYLARLQVAIQHLHKCGAIWRQTVPVHEVFRSQTVWQGDRFVAVLEIPSVKDAQSAVKVAIASESKNPGSS